MIPDNLREYPAVAALESAHADAVAGGSVIHGQLRLDIAPAGIGAVCRFLKENRQFRLSAITAVDWFPAEPRFHVVYLLQSFANRERLRLVCALQSAKPEIDSVTGVWRAANWYEREVYDLFGVVFRNHPDLRRIMMPEDWAGHPLRKDYPVAGYRYTYQHEGQQ